MAKSETPAQIHDRVVSKAANKETAYSYFADGRYNRGGWSTYASAEELASNAKPRTYVPNPKKPTRVFPQ